MSRIILPGGMILPGGIGRPPRPAPRVIYSPGPLSPAPQPCCGGANPMLTNPSPTPTPTPTSSGYTFGDIGGCNCPVPCVACGQWMVPTGIYSINWTSTTIGSGSSTLTFNPAGPNWTSPCLNLMGSNWYQFLLICPGATSPALDISSYTSLSNCNSGTSGTSAGFGNPSTNTQSPLSMGWTGRTLLGIDFTSMTVSTTATCLCGVLPCNLAQTVNYTLTASNFGAQPLTWDLGTFVCQWATNNVTAGGLSCHFLIRAMSPSCTFALGVAGSSVCLWESVPGCSGATHTGAMTLTSFTCSPLSVVWTDALGNTYTLTP
jgi:hypothetical protein